MQKHNFRSEILDFDNSSSNGDSSYDEEEITANGIITFDKHTNIIIPRPSIKLHPESASLYSMIIKLICYYKNNNRYFENNDSLCRTIAHISNILSEKYLRKTLYGNVYKFKQSLLDEIQRMLKIKLNVKGFDLLHLLLREGSIAMYENLNMYKTHDDNCSKVIKLEDETNDLQNKLVSSEEQYEFAIETIEDMEDELTTVKRENTLLKEQLNNVKQQVKQLNDIVEYPQYKRRKQVVCIDSDDEE